MSHITAAELAGLPRLTREEIAAPTVERGQRIRELHLPALPITISGYEESQDWHALVRALVPTRP